MNGALVLAMVTIALGLSQWRLPAAGPDLLMAWLIALALYGEGRAGRLWAFWIATMHAFPLVALEPWRLLFPLTVWFGISFQRYAVGRDHLLPRMLLIGGAVMFGDTLQWSKLGESRPEFGAVSELIFFHAGISALAGLPLIWLARRLAEPLGLRQTRFDF